MGFLRMGGSAAIGAFGAWLAVALGLTGPIGIAFAFALAVVFIIGTYFYTNNDGSMDIYIPNATLALIPIYIAIPDPQSLPIMVKGMWTIVPL